MLSVRSLEDIQALSDAEIVRDLRLRVNKTRIYHAILAEAKARRLQGCDGCSGNGIYYGRGYVENGVFKGFTGKCFRCDGKGFQNAEDRKRNWGYDNYYRRIES